MQRFTRPSFPLKWSLLALLCMAVMAPAPTRAQAPTADALKKLEDQVFALVNQRRAEAGLAPYTRAAELDAAARRHSLDMATADYLGHTGSDGSAPVDRTRAAGYDSTFVGENAAAGYTTAQAVMDGWMNEPPPAPHRANILNADYKEIGISVAYQAGSQYRYYWTQDFGARAAVPTGGGGTAPAPTGTEPGTLHLTAVTSDGKLWHTVRTTNGAWTAFGDVKTQTGDPGFIVDADVQVIGSGATAALHVCAITSDGKLWHTVRYPNGNWGAFGDVAVQAGDPGRFVSAALANVNDELHICGVTTDGKLWHTIRYANGNWAPFGDVKGQSGDPGAFTRVAATVQRDVQTGAQGLYVVGVISDGRLFQTGRDVNGAWWPFAPLTSGVSGPFAESDVAFTGSGSGTRRYLAELTSGGQFSVVTDSYGQLAAAGQIESMGSLLPHPATRVSIGPVSDASPLMHMAAVTSDGGIWHQIGSPGAWPGFGDVKRQAGDPGVVVSVSLDGLVR
jgi:uncharacterized protein YkwD